MTFRPELVRRTRTVAPHVLAVNRTLAQVLLNTDELVPITTWQGYAGQECDPEHAYACVAGPSSTGQWFAVDLTQFDPAVPQ